MPKSIAMPKSILAVNAGSSSIKFGLFHSGDREPKLVSKGVLDDSGEAPLFSAHDPDGKELAAEQWDCPRSHEALLCRLLTWIDDHVGAASLSAVGHRVVHGGADFTRPILLTPEAITAIEHLTPLAPLHQPRCLEPIHAMASIRPDLPQVACFDTAFHDTMAPLVSRYAVPRRFEDDGIRKYGFHGLSYEYVAGHIGAVLPELAARRTVIAHLGSGASLCALRNGRSIDTSMGFSALDGLIMGTRCGAIDPGVVLYLQTVHGLTAKDVEDVLYHQSGILGLSGISHDVRALLASDDLRAREALDLFTFSIARQTALMANSLGGLEGLVFTGGIGEHIPEIRIMTSKHLGWLGVELDPAANQVGVGQISRSESRVVVHVVPTNEELAIARHVQELVAGQGCGPSLA